jgi:hypothetical protein
VIYLLLGLAIVCVIEGAAIYFIGKRMASLKEQTRVSAAAVAAARKELEGVNELLKSQKTAEGEAKDEKQELQDTPDNGLAGRANSLFSS